MCVGVIDVIIYDSDMANDTDPCARTFLTLYIHDYQIYC